MPPRSNAVTVAELDVAVEEIELDVSLFEHTAPRRRLVALPSWRDDPFLASTEPSPMVEAVLAYLETLEA